MAKKEVEKKEKPKKDEKKEVPAEKPVKKVKKKRAKKKVSKKEKAPHGKVHVYDVDGKSKKTIDMPPVFDEPVRPDLILRDVTASRANRRQPYGPMHRAGMRHSVEWWGKGRGVSRVPRLKDSRTAAQAPCVVGGRRAFPPRTDKIWAKKVNRKERALARKAAISALKVQNLVEARGHRFDKTLSLPIVIEDKFEEFDKTKEVIDTFSALGLYEDIQRAKNGTKIRAGRGKMRGRRLKKPKSLLIVIKERKGVERSARNLPGVDIVTVDQLNTEIMAPGGVPGRLSVFTEGAFKALRGN